jgi:predicted amidohydrolase YtcJ
MSFPSADLILENGRVITCNPRQPRAEAVAIKGGKVLFVGSTQEAGGLKTRATRTLNCQGQTLVPGFIDAHCHVLALARSLASLDLSPAKVRSIGDIQAVLQAQIEHLPPGEWVRGVNYNEFYLAEKRHPTRFDLDLVSPLNPVLLVHRSLHACVLNSLALSLAGIGMETAEPENALIERDLETGEPNGLLFEMLDHLANKTAVGFAGERQIKAGLAEASRYFLSLGITSLVDATVTNDLSSWQFYRTAKGEGILQPRLNLMFGFSALPEVAASGLSAGSGDENLRLGHLKITLSETRGQLQPAQAELAEMVQAAARRGFPAALHAVEYSTVDAALRALESSVDSARSAHLRQRVEHCSECPPDLLARLKKVGALVASQPAFLYYSGERYLAQVPPKTQRWLYPFNSWLEAGLRVAGSSDTPVAPANPLVGIYAAAARRAQTGQDLGAEQAIAPQQALLLYTLNAAYSTGEERLKGSLQRGKLADIAVLDGDPLDCPLEKLKNIRVEMTILGGEVVWELGALQA